MRVVSALAFLGGALLSAGPARAEPFEDPTRETDVSLGLGALLSAGNARQVAVASSGRLRLRREEHQASAAASVNLARSGKPGEEVASTVESYQGLLRYDRFLDERISLFLQSTGRRDRFQGLDLRLNVDPGLAYYFLHERTHRLQGEAGYDLQYDVRRDASRVIPPGDEAPAGTPEALLARTRTLHDARLFLGYENRLRKEVRLLASLEYLPSFADLSTYRLVFDLGLRSNVSDRLALAVAFTTRYESQPLPNVEPLDSLMSVQLVYSLF